MFKQLRTASRIASASRKQGGSAPGGTSCSTHAGQGMGAVVAPFSQAGEPKGAASLAAVAEPDVGVPPATAANIGRTLVVSMASGGYELAFARCLDSQRAYAERRGFDYRPVVLGTDTPLGREIAWLKVPLLLGGLDAGYGQVLFVDADVRISERAPSISQVLEAYPGKDIFAADGHSGRPNSGVIIARNTPSAKFVLRQMLAHAGDRLPKEHRVGWGENGYFIAVTAGYQGFQKIGPEWNNTFDLDLVAFLTHYTGPMRQKYDFDSDEARAWDKIQTRPKSSGEAQIGDRAQFTANLTAIYTELSCDIPELAPADTTWFERPLPRHRPVSGCLRVCFCPGGDETYRSYNPYLLGLISELEKQDLKLTVGEDAFWAARPGDYDIIHVQWIEALFGWKKPSEDDLKRLTAHLDELRPGTRIVLTVHNLRLKADYGEMANRLLDAFGDRTDLFLHLSEASIAGIKYTYGARRWAGGTNHLVAAHGDYSHYWRMPRSGKRKLPKNHVLFFGGLRSQQEYDLVGDVSASLLKSGIPVVQAGRIADNIMNYAEKRALLKSQTGKHKRYPLGVDDSDIIDLFSSASCLVLSRHARLNSGVLFLAYTFLKPVVAPAEFSMFEVQQEIGGPTYRPGDSNDALRAVKELLNLDLADRLALERRIQLFRDTRMSWGPIGEAHEMAYRQAFGLRKEE